MKKKFKTILSLSLSSVVLLGSVSALVGVYYSASSDNVYVSPKIDSSPTYISDTGYLDSKISSPIETQPNITNVVSNQYGLAQSYKSAQKSITDVSNISFYKYGADNTTISAKSISDNITSENLQKDIFYSFEQAFYDNRNIQLTLSSSDISYDNNNLSFNYVLNIKKSDAAIDFRFNNISFFIPEGTNFDVTFTVQNQPILVNIKGNYVYWSVSNVDVLINGVSINKFNTVLTFNSQNDSYAIPYQFTNLSTEDDYNEVSNNSSNIPDIDIASLKEQVYQHIEKYKNLSLSAIGLISNILNELTSDPTVANFLGDISTDVASFLVQLGLIPDGSQTIITDFLKNQNSVKSIISNNASEISDIIMQYLPIEFTSLMNKDVLTSYIIPKLLDGDQTVISIINDVVPSQYAPLVSSLLNLITSDTTKPFDMIQSILESSELTTLISSSQELSKYQPVIDLLKTFFENQNQTVLKVIVDNKDLLVELINMLIGGNAQSQSSTSTLFSMFITNNSNFNESNLLSLIKNTLAPLASFVANSNNYTIIEDGENAWTKDLSLDTTNNTYSFQYNMSVKFNSDFTISMSGIKSICPSLISTAWSIYLFDSATIKAGDKLDWVFSANNQKLIYSPNKQQDGNYYGGYLVPFNFNLRLNMPGLFNSITTQYERYFALGFGSAGLDGLGYDFIKTVLQSFLLPDYDFYESFNYVDLTKSIENYNDSLYIPDIVYTMNQSYDTSQIQNYITFSSVNATNLTFSNSNNVGSWFGGSKTVTESITGNKPEITVDNQKALLEYLYPEYDYWMSLPSNLQPVISVIPTVDGTISFAGSISGAINLNLSVKILNISIQFPYKIYDKDTQKFESSFKTSISM